MKYDSTFDRQATQMEAIEFLKKAYDLAKELDLTINVSSVVITIHEFRGETLSDTFEANYIFESEHIDNVVDFLEGVAIGRETRHRGRT